MNRITTPLLATRQARRARLAALSFAEKLKILEMLRDRDRAIAAARVKPFIQVPRVAGVIPRER